MDAADATTADTDTSVDMPVDMGPLTQLDDSMEDDWFVSQVSSQYPAISASLSLVQSTTTFLLGFTSQPVGATIASMNKPRSLSQEYGSMFAINPTDLAPAPSLMDDMMTFVVPTPRSFTLFGTQSGITGFTQVSTGGPIASIALDILDTGNSTFVSSNTVGVTGFQTAVLGGGSAKNSLGMDPLRLVAASDNGLFVNGTRYARPLPADGRFVTTDGPFAAFVRPPDFLLFDPFTPTDFKQLNNNNTLNIALGFVGLHGPSGEAQFLLAHEEQNNGFTISLQYVDWTEQNPLIPVAGLPVVSLPGVDPQLIDVTTYFDPMDANDAANPANAIVTTVETEGGDTFVAFRVILIEDQNLELIACRRFQVPVIKTEMTSVVYRDDGDDIVAAAATLYHAPGDDTVRRFGVDGIRFPNLNVPDASLQNPYDATCQTCNPFQGCTQF